MKTCDTLVTQRDIEDFFGRDIDDFRQEAQDFLDELQAAREADEELFWEKFSGRD